jgi:prepilin-type N-terminal cleavage/methylation domain-containing protein
VAQRGFTLVEMMITIAVIGVLMALSFPVYIAYQNRNNLSLTTEQVVAMIRRAETFSRGVSGDSTWGVAFQSGAVTLYKGASYAARDSTYDEVVTIPANITRTGLSEVNFAKLTAVPSATGTITFITGENDGKTITLNAEGMVAY